MPTRRTFLRDMTTAAATATTLPWAGSVLAAASANDRPGFVQIGLGSMGQTDASSHLPYGNLIALCDVDSDRAKKVQAKGAKQLAAEAAQKAEVVSDYRRLLERSDIDFVSISTVDHWHVKIAIEAFEAGKHVFCQKPLTLTVEEGELIAAARRKHPNLVFQVGTQQRATKRFLRAVNLVRQDLLGPLKKLTIGIDGGLKGGPFPAAEVPTGFDWETWQGQAATRPYRKKRVHYTFRWWYEYSGGKFTDWGAHHIDIALWAIGRNGADTPADKRLVRIDGTDVIHPVEFADGYPLVDDCYNTAIDFNVVCHFADGLEMHVSSRPDNGILFEGEKGRLFVNRGKIKGTPIEEKWDEGLFGEDQLRQLYKGKPAEDHKQNFYRCMMEGGEPISDTASHIAAMDICHLSAIASRLGRVVAWDQSSRTCPGDEQATAMLSRKQRAGYEIPRL